MFLSFLITRTRVGSELPTASAAAVRLLQWRSGTLFATLTTLGVQADFSVSGRVR